MRSVFVSLALALMVALLTVPSAAFAAKPTISATGVSKVAETAATLSGKVDAGGKNNTEYRFDYIPLATYEDDGESFGAGTLSLPSPVVKLPAHPEAKGDLAAGSTTVKNLTVTRGILDAGQAISGAGIPPGTTISTLGEGTLTLSQSVEAGNTAAAVKLTATGPQPVLADLTELAPGTGYRARLFAENADGHGESTILAFATLRPSQAFDPCANDVFRHAASAGLPDCRAYEQATPTEKNGNDAVGVPPIARAASNGGAISFGAPSAVPGGEGAQMQPIYLATRWPGEPNWLTSGLMAPSSTGPWSEPVGWLPDFSASFAFARNYDSNPRTEALFELHPDGSPPTQIAPYVSFLGGHTYSYVGASGDGGLVIFDSANALPAKEGESPLPGARQDSPNVYAWDRESGRLSLVSQLNTEAETQATLAKGGFAGPYTWAGGLNAQGLTHGGAENGYYLQDEHVIAKGGSVFFTATGTGQLYERLNPTEPQSPLDGQGNCTDPTLACTMHVSATEKTNGLAEGADSGGPQPAAFMAASADGKVAFFASPEKLTNDANTGPEQPPAQIGRAVPGGEDPQNTAESSVLPAHALGIAISPDGSHIYWANPANHSIGRARLNGSGEAELIEPEYIAPEPTECVNFPSEEPGVLHAGPALPRYVAVDAEHVYWTNTGPLGSNILSGLPGQEPVAGCGTIGRATINPIDEKPEEVKPEWITGGFQPEGIAVDAINVYWANGGDVCCKPNPSIGRATIEGEDVEQDFVDLSQQTPHGMALDAGYLYYGSDTGAYSGNNWSFINRISVEDGTTGGVWLGPGSRGVRGIVVIDGDVYWANREKEAIGRMHIDLTGGECGTKPDCEPEYLKLEGGPEGLTSDPGGAHIYWSVNGEAPTNPGNDLYRWSLTPDEAGHHLTDMSVDAIAESGANVQGVLGASADGSYVYFVANGVLAAGAEPGDCHSTNPHGTLNTITGTCNLYLWHQGGSSFIARLNPGGGQHSEALNWTPTPNGVISPNTYTERTSLLSSDGRTLLFTSAEQLTEYDNQGTRELYRFHLGDSPLIRCVSCNPTGVPPLAEPTIATINYPSSSPRNEGLAAVAGRFLADQGKRAFFESTEALTGADVNGRQDVYEWEAPGEGTCTESVSSYSPLNKGCLYLISDGKSSSDAFFADADEAGANVFFFTRSQLVPQDTGQSQDVYDARIEGGLAAQHAASLPPCGSAEACRGPGTGAAKVQGAGSASFQGPGDSPQPHLRDCGPSAQRALDLARAAKQASRAARHLQGKVAAQKRHRAAKLAAQAKSISAKAKACRRANRGARR